MEFDVYYDYLCPFVYRASVLLLHGFAGSPFEMHELGRRLEERGLGMYAPALPGHATASRDLRSR